MSDPLREALTECIRYVETDDAGEPRIGVHELAVLRRANVALAAHPPREPNSHWYVSPEQWDRLRKLLVTPHEHLDGMNECAICDESLVNAAADEIIRLRSHPPGDALREAVELIARAAPLRWVIAEEQAAAQEWEKEAEAFLDRQSAASAPGETP